MDARSIQKARCNAIVKHLSNSALQSQLHKTNCRAPPQRHCEPEDWQAKLAVALGKACIAVG